MNLWFFQSSSLGALCSGGAEGSSVAGQVRPFTARGPRNRRKGAGTAWFRLLSGSAPGMAPHQTARTRSCRNYGISKRLRMLPSLSRNQAALPASELAMPFSVFKPGRS